MYLFHEWGGIDSIMHDHMIPTDVQTCGDVILLDRVIFYKNIVCNALHPGSLDILILYTCTSTFVW